MVCEIVRTSAACCHVDEPPKGILRAFKPFGAVDRMQVEDSCTHMAAWQEALIVALDKTHSAVNQRDAIFAEIFSHLIEEALQRRSWYVNLRDHFRRRKRSVELVFDFAVVIVWIDT